MKQNVKLTQNSNETKLKINNRTIDVVACDYKNTKSKAVDLRNQLNKNVNQNLKKWNALREHENQKNKSIRNFKLHKNRLKE